MASAEPTADARTATLDDSNDLTEAADDLSAVAEVLDDVDAEDVADASDEELAALRDALKSVEDAAEDARKDGVEEEMDDRCAPGESIAGLTRVQSHKKYVKDGEAAVDALVAAGVDARRVMSPDATALAEVAEEEGVPAAREEVGEASYTYFR